MSGYAWVKYDGGSALVGGGDRVKFSYRGLFGREYRDFRGTACGMDGDNPIFIKIKMEKGQKARKRLFETARIRDLRVWPPENSLFQTFFDAYRENEVDKTIKETRRNSYP